MSANNFLPVNSLDVIGLEDNLIAFAKGIPQFKDYDFTGSNISGLIQLLAYNGFLLSFYTSMALNESFLDTAVVRDSVVSRAKELNYCPRSARSAEGNIDITVFPSDSPAYVLLSAGTPFQGTNGNSVFTFLTATDTLIYASNGVYSVNNVSIFEGVNVSESFAVNTSLDDQRFILSNPNIDTTSLVVSVSNTSGQFNTWNFSQTLLGVETADPVWFLQATANNYEIIFGNNVVGMYPPNGSTVLANYRVCNLDQPNGIKNFKAASTIGGYSSFTVTTSLDSNGNVLSASGGAPAESVESIKFNAPRSYQTLDRAIVESDYENIIRQTFPEVRAVNVYGGNQVTPPQYGKVFIAVDVTNAVGLSDAESSKIQNYVATKTMMTPVVVSPDYIFAKVVTNIEYNLNISSLAPDDIENEVLTSISNYNNANLIDFGTTLRYSQLCTAIDASDTSITSSDTTLYIFKQIDPILNVNYSGSLNYQNQLVPGSFSSSAFVYNNIIASLTDDGLGHLEISSTINGAKTILSSSTGTINYTTGVVTISGLNVSSFTGDGINIYATTVLHDISSSQNVILEIDTTEVVVSVLGVRK